MSRFLVTGGAGFIGSHIVEYLLKEGHFVRVLDNFSSGKRKNLDFTDGQAYKNNFELKEGDICDKSACLIAASGMDFVLHQAALRSVPKSMKYPRDYNEVNINGTLNMLEASRENKIKCFVFASSSSVYGDVKKFPEKESFVPAPISPYALSKLSGEHYCRIFSIHYGLPTVSLRYFNVFGPRQSLDDEYAVVVPKFISCMLKGEAPPIFGNGKQSRDFTYVSNVARANFLAATRQESYGRTFNVAGGRDYSVLQLAEILNRLMGKNIKPVFLPVRTGDVFKTSADLTLARKILKYSPAVGFVEGLNKAMEFFKVNT